MEKKHDKAINKLNHELSKIKKLSNNQSDGGMSSNGEQPSETY